MFQIFDNDLSNQVLVWIASQNVIVATVLGLSWVLLNIITIIVVVIVGIAVIYLAGGYIVLLMISIVGALAKENKESSPLDDLKSEIYSEGLRVKHLIYIFLLSPSIVIVVIIKGASLIFKYIGHTFMWMCRNILNPILNFKIMSFKK